MKLCLRLLTGVLVLSFLPLCLCVPPLCLFVVAWEYTWTGNVRGIWRMDMGTVRGQETKNKALRQHLAEWINARPGRWLLGINVADDVRVHLRSLGIHTTGEVLAKELRKAQRKGEIRKRIRPLSKYVEYKALAPNGMLFDSDSKIHGKAVMTRKY